MKRYLLFFVGLVVVFGLIFALRSRSEPNEVIVLCGGSTRAVLEEIIRRYKEVSDDVILATYGGSGDLCAQIQNTGRGDVYLCHDPFMPWAEKKGMIAEWQPVGYMDVVIITAKNNPKNVTKIEDFGQPGLRLGLGNKTRSSSGVIAYHMLEKLSNFEDIKKNVRVETKGHQQRCGDVAMGMLDASIVWKAVAVLFKDKLDIIPIPYDNIDAVTTATYGTSDLKNVAITLGLTVYAKGNAAAERFYKFATVDCKEVYSEYNFRAEPE